MAETPIDNAIVRPVALSLAAEIRHLFWRATKEGGRMFDAQDPADELCDAVVGRVLLDDRRVRAINATGEPRATAFSCPLPLC